MATTSFSCESSSSSSPELRSNFPDKRVPGFVFEEEVLEDLSSRFILNLPQEELASVERVCFQVEQAHWYYEDFIREDYPKFPSLPLKKFSAMLFHACPLLKQWSHDHEQAFNTFMHYKTRVPVCGAIMLNKTWDKCVLVKGWKASSGWGFPRGKINQNEAAHSCAIREVLEETGFDLTNMIELDHFLEISIREQTITLFLVGGVPEDFNFRTKTRKEISNIQWFKLSELPTWRRNKPASNRFYLISPFIPGLKQFLNAKKSRESAANTQDLSIKPSPDAPSTSTRQTDASQNSQLEATDPSSRGPREPADEPMHLFRLLTGLEASASKLDVAP